MAKWKPVVITEKGLALQAKVEAGAALVFTKVALGSGKPANLAKATALASMKQKMTIASKQVKGNTCTIYATSTNKDVKSEYAASELGLFAKDPQAGEILFAITTDDSPETVPVGTSATVITQRIGLTVSISSSSNITTIIETTGFITAADARNISKEEVDSHNGNSNAHANGIDGNAASANKLKTAVKINNTSFDGTRDITTDKWGKARKISISDATKTNTGIAVNVDGGSDLSLLLPAKMKVDIDGNATKLKNKVRVGIVGKVNAVPAWFDGSENINIKIDKVLESEKAINDAKGNKIDTTYLQLVGGTLTGGLSNEAKYTKIAKSINATATGSGEDEESIIVALDKNNKIIGNVNIERNKQNKNNQLRVRVVNKTWSDFRVIQNDDGTYWAEYAGGPGTNLYIPKDDKSYKIPTTRWVSEATTAAAKKLDTAKAINVVGDFLKGTAKVFDGTTNIDVPLDLDKTIKDARIVAQSLGSNGYIKWANGFILQWGQIRLYAATYENNVPSAVGKMFEGDFILPLASNILAVLPAQYGGNLSIPGGAVITETSTTNKVRIRMELMRTPNLGSIVGYVVVLSKE